MSEPLIVVFGNAQELRTEIELSWVQPDGSETLTAVVFETTEGWIVDVVEPRLQASLGSDFRAAVESAKVHLSQYVNRRGNEVPDGLTVAGLSLWLMEKIDGTAMGQPM